MLIYSSLRRGSFFLLQSEMQFVKVTNHLIPWQWLISECDQTSLRLLVNS